MKSSRISQISEDMFEIGQRFSDKAKEAKNAKVAKQSFDIAERAYKLVLKVEGENGSVDMALKFIAVISEKMLRADIWRSYLGYCGEHNIVSVSKSELFARMESLDFMATRKSDGVYFIPPKTPNKILRLAKASQCNQQSDTLPE